MKDQLFLLQPGFFNGEDGPLYCGDSVSVEGLLSFAPGLRDAVDVHYLAFPRPREALVALLGAEHQGAPVLILSDGAVAPAEPTKEAAGKRFIDDEKAIRSYPSARYGAPAAS